jgi:hypothetical protein
MTRNVSNPGDLGRLGHLDGRELLTFVRRLAYPSSMVWGALTEVEHSTIGPPEESERVHGVTDGSDTG